MSKEWYAKVMGKKVGPMTGGQLKQLAVQQRLTPEDLIRKGESGSWTPANRVKGLFDKRVTVVPQGQQRPVESSQLMMCPDCKKPVSRSAKACPNCGRPQETENPDTSQSQESSPVLRKRSKIATVIQYAFGFLFGIQALVPSVWKEDVTQALFALIMALGLIPYTWDKFRAWTGVGISHPIRTRFFTIFATLMAVVFVGAAIEATDPNSSPQSSGSQSDSLPRDKQILYIDYATDLIKTKLKSPSTASFPSILFNLSAYKVEPQGGGSYKVSGYVDAQNGFGAKIRSYWIAELTIHDGHVKFGDAYLLE